MKKIQNKYNHGYIIHATYGACWLLNSNWLNDFINDFVLANDFSNLLTQPQISCHIRNIFAGHGGFRLKNINLT